MNATQFLDRLKQISRSELEDIHGMGSILADNYLGFLESERFSHIYTKFENLEKQGNQMQIQDSTSKNQIQGHLTGEIICITGTFEIPRNNIKAELENYGAKVVDAVTKKTTILLAGEAAGSKLAKAKKLGIKIVENRLDLYPN